MPEFIIPPYDPQKESRETPPISCKENLRLAYSGRTPCWMPYTGWCGTDVQIFRPRIFPDNMATHLVFDGEEPPEYTDNVMRGWFDLDWIYVPEIDGATVKPGDPKIEDMNDWESIIRWPDLDALDWQAMGRANKEYLSSGKLNLLGMLCGFWERLMSLMDVSGAAIALIDEDQKDAVHRFFDRYADFQIDCIRHVKAVCDIDAVLIHDDWGTQRAPFFSLDTAMEMLVPYLKRVVDYIHSEGMYYEQHSCGNCTPLVPAYIKAGVNIWTAQAMNDVDSILETYKDQNFYIAFEEGVDQYEPEPTEEESRELARRFFSKYGDKKVTYAGFDPYIADELYKLSRIAYNR